MKFYPTLAETLARRFEDMDEVRDISNHGIQGGFNGFLYNYEINEFFNEFESEIEDYLDDLGYTFSDLVKDEVSFQGIRNKCVWIVVEAFCHHKVDLLDEATFNEIGYTIAC